MKKQVRIIVAGGRDFQDYDLLKGTLDDLISEKYSDYRVIIVSGAANGADKLGEQYAEERNCEVAKFPADWRVHDHEAGHHRNLKMAEYAKPHTCPLMGEVEGVLVAFWDGKSKGTRNMIQNARRKKLEIVRIKY